MAKITNQSSLNVGTEIVINEPNRTIQLIATGNLIAKDGVQLQAVYSLLIALWNTATYQDSPFPMTVGNIKAGDYQIGTDGSSFNGWRWLDDTTRNMLRDGGWNEYDASGTILRRYSGFVGLGAVNAGAQPYYILDAADAPTDFPFDDQFNAGVQIFGNAANGNFDKQTFARVFIREEGSLYADSTLVDTGSTLGPDIARFLSSNQADDKIADTDANVAANAPYTGITVTYFAADQNRNIGGTNYPFRVIVEGNGATLEQIYTKVQYLLRQDADIDSGPGSVNGKTADLLMAFQGDTLSTTQGVFIDNINANDTNRVQFLDQNNVSRQFPFVAAGTITFSPNMAIGGGGTYRLMYASPPGAGNDYGEAGAITVNDGDGNPITGIITAESISFTFDYDGNTQGGFTAGTDRAVVLFGVTPGQAKPATFSGTISRSKGLSFSLVSPSDPAYQEAA